MNNMRITFIALLFFPIACFSQQPLIKKITPQNGTVGENIIISGSNLNGSVFFGGVLSPNIQVSAHSIKAEVPAGASSGPITIITSDNQFVQSSDHFTLSFGGETINAFSPEALISTNEPDGYDICTCDLNSDGLNDVIISHNISSNDGNEIAIYQNSSTGNNLSFEDVINIRNNENNGGFISVECGDLDLDGKLDLVFTTNDGTNQKHIYIYENVSSTNIQMNYQSDLSLRLPNVAGNNRNPRKIKIADMDLDGKPDLVVGNENDSTVHIFLGSSNGDGNFAFESPVEVNVGDAETTGSIEIADLNGDVLPDLIVVPFSKGDQNIFILKNNSVPGLVSFRNQDGIISSDRRLNVSIADFNKDGLNDFAVTSDINNNIRGGEKISVYRNVTSGPTIVFSSATNLSVPANLPWGLDIGDLNGDGLDDIAVACVGNNVFLFENQSSSVLSFASPIELSTTVNARNIEITDLNGDAKPDVAFTHNVDLGNIGDLGVFENENCIVPEITPGPDNLSFCVNESFTLFATNSVGATYEWEIASGDGNVPGNTGPNNFAEFIINSGSSVQISVTITQGGCSESTIETYSIENGAITPTPSISIDQPGTVCANTDIELSTAGSFDNYLWTLPDGSQVTTPTLVLTGVSSENVGGYELKVKNDGACFSEPDSFELIVSEAPQLVITNTDLDNFCGNGQNNPTLRVADIGLSYQWKRNGNVIDGETSSTYSASETGQYTVEVTNEDGCATETEQYQINRIAEPSVSISGQEEICVGLTSTFEANATGDPRFPLNYTWYLFDDSNNLVDTSYEQSPSFDFLSVGNFILEVTAGYNPTEVEGCEASGTFNIQISDTPTISFTVDNNTFKCSADSLEIGLTSPEDIIAYRWVQNNDTTTLSTVYAKTGADDISVELQVLVTTAIGCEVQGSIMINDYESTLSITPETGIEVRDTLVSGEVFPLYFLDDEIFLNLRAAGGSEFRWSADNGTFSDNSIEETVFFPSQSISQVALSGTDDNGCTTSVLAYVSLDDLQPRKTFSPNGDGQNDWWEILNINELGDGCVIYIYDSRGRNILVENQDDKSGCPANYPNCVWDGTFNGNQVPQGVYYFTLKCEDDVLTRSGSILLAR